MSKAACLLLMVITEPHIVQLDNTAPLHAETLQASGAHVCLALFCDLCQ